MIVKFKVFQVTLTLCIVCKFFVFVFFYSYSHFDMVHCLYFVRLKCQIYGIIGQIKENNREAIQEILNRILGRILGIIGSGLQTTQ